MKPFLASFLVAVCALGARPAHGDPFDTEYRQILDEMLAVDTSHGNESKLLGPIAERYKKAGVPVQILESAPGRGNLVARLKGSGKKKPLLLLAHVDVVPVEGQKWSVPTFAATEKDGFLWGRGVNDDKGMAAAVVAVTLELARAKTPLSRDVIVALTAGEETGGGPGARWLVEKHRDLIDAGVALNEGGAARLSDDFSRVEAIDVGVAEKTYQTWKLVAHGVGGHSSVPPTEGDPMTALGRAVVRIGEKRFPARVLPEARGMLQSAIESAKPEFAPALRHVVASAPKVAPADEAVLARDRQYNALIRTTCVVTMLQGSAQENVLPTTAEATVNCRILPGDTREQVQAALVEAAGDAKIEVLPLENIGDGPSTPAEGEVWDAVKKAAAQSFKGAPIVASMSTGASDSRFLRGVGIPAYGVTPLAISHAEGMASHGAHGPDERRPLKWIPEMTHFWRQVVRTLVM